MRAAISCSNELAKPHRIVKNRNQAIASVITRTRPSRSQSIPAIQPPNAEEISDEVPSRPASAVEMLHAAISVGIRKLYICASSASTAQPPKQA